MLKIIRELGVKVSLVFDPNKMSALKKGVSAVAEGVSGISLAVGSAAVSLAGIAGITSHHTRELEANSQQLGINVERLQELQYAAKVAANVSKEELGGALEGISQTLFEARNNNVEAARTFIRLGVPLDLIKDKSVTADKVLMVLSEKFKNMPDGMYKTALATEAFGSSGSKLIPLLNKGAHGIAGLGKEARSFGVILSEGAIKKGAEFDRQWSKIWIVMKNITYLIGNQLIKYFTPMVMQFQKFLIVNRQLIGMGLGLFFKTVGETVMIVFKGVMMLGNGLQYLVKWLGGVQNATRLLTAVMLGLVAGPFGLIGAAVTGLFLILQDLFSDNSLIKEWAGQFSKAFPNLTKLMKGIVDQILILPERISGAFQIIGKWIDWASERISSFLSNFTLIGQAWKTFQGLGLQEKASSLFESAKNKVSGFIGSTGAALQQNAQERVGLGGGGSNVNQTNHMNATINVTVPKGTKPEDAEKIVSKGTEKGFLDALREARNQVIGGVAY